MWAFAKVIAHRGAGRLAPENTLSAIRCGLSHGYNAVEFDVMLTKDLEAVLMHDECVGRTIRLPHKPNAQLCELDFSEISDVDAGSWLSEGFSDARVPLFKDVLKFCCDNRIWMNIEIKPCAGHETVTGRIVAMETLQFFSKTAADESQWPLFSSFSLQALAAAQAVAPQIKRGLLIDSLANTPQWREQCREIEAYSLHVNHLDVSAELVDEVKSLGLGLFCYTVNDVERARQLLEMGVDAFCTDELIKFNKFP